MRKISVVLAVLFLVTAAGATTIQQETVVIDLSDSSVDITAEVGELTSSDFSYISNYQKQNVYATVDGEKVPCDIQRLQLGSEIKCDVGQKSNFTVNMNFTGEDFVSSRGKTRIFRYTQSIYRPTEDYKIRVLLPRGAGIADQVNVSTPVVSPENAEIGSNGQRIFVEWDQKPSLGENLQFQIVYEEFSSEPNNYLQIGLIAAGVIILGILGFFIFRQISKESIENYYEGLSEDEIDVIEMLRENDGEMLQKEVVESSDYSKAKISGVVSELVEKELVKKKKEGRSNKLTINRRYKF